MFSAKTRNLECNRIAEQKHLRWRHSWLKVVRRESTAIALRNGRTLWVKAEESDVGSRETNLKESVGKLGNENQTVNPAPDCGGETH